ncbi:extracellular solute-binding protein [Occultella aeris]|uniref:Bacterial extracellular solute-binding protein n=2 Tax=Occultella aeris TaxID=2761496 RepID=A0A7M4DQE7_9MICO|nr:extracellular solute-binding protein [Occultella aeris]VZO39691.1 Bacterial extracellular solute-binding protein [Occultella aeris]
MKPIFLNRRDVLRLGGVAALGTAVGGSLVACSSGGPKMQYMFWGSTAEQEAVEGMLSSFQGTLPEDADLTVEPLYTPDDYDTKLNALIASNRMPDIAYINNPMAYRLAEQDRLLDLGPYFDDYPGIGERLPEAYNYWSETQTFGTPAALEIMCLFTNKKAFSEAGIELPPVTADGAWTWDAFVDAAYRLTVDQNGRRPDEDGFDTTQVARFGTLANMWSAAWYGLLLSNGVDVVDESGTTTQLNSPEAVEVLQNLVDLMHVHRVAPSPTQLGNNAPSTPSQLASDRLGMAIDGQWALLDISGADFEYGIGVLPSYGTPSTASMGGAIGISAETEHLDEALELYTYQSDPSVVSLFSSGLWMPVEEKYYTDDELVKVWIDNDAHPEEYRTAVVDYTVSSSKRYFAERMKNFEEIDKVIVPAMERIQTGEEDVQTVMDEVAGQLNDGMLQGFYPNPLV